MSIGKTIRIYLDDGSVSGIRHAEIVNWTGQAVSSPRSKIKSLTSWSESKKPGVYFLFGVDEESGEDAVYIGEAENVFERLQNHLDNKDFWNEVVFFTSKDENLTKSHVKYLESRLVQLAKLSSRHVVLNGNEPQLPVLPRGDRDAMEEFISNLKILLGVVGYKTLESLEKKSPKDILEQDSIAAIPLNEEVIELNLKVKGINAKAHLTDEGIVVLATSHVSEAVKDSLSAGYKKLREQLIQNGTLEKSNSGYIFTKNQLFKSPSQAAAIIVGYSINGRHHWQTTNGVTLKSIEESNIKSI
ncbi:MAG: GIY-YIG nuclease family protein [Candidatus Scalindua sediminis]|nr:GIY-YIG nuclease family protein [Candidatus Scalindua sediminis]